ncbi:MAG: hypothetical protein ACLVLH_13275 [Eisenbergiella massiliensis]
MPWARTTSEDNILSRVTPERTYSLLKQAKDANFNCIRVWGGGNYPYDSFWDACDELGLVVWEDFMFACAVYDLTEEFEETITAEFIDNIKRIRHHASLGLWCGNNEMEMFVAQGNWVSGRRRRAITLKCTNTSFPRCSRNTIPIPFTGPQAPPQAALSMIPTMKTGVMYTTGTYGMETSQSRNIGNSTSAMSPNSASSPSPP